MNKRELTVQDLPQLQELLAAWKSLFNYPLDKTQLYVWASCYDQDVILKAFDITESFVKGRAPSKVKNADAYRYASSVMRNTAALADKVAELLGGVQ